MDEMDEDYQFDDDISEMGQNDSSVEYKYRKIDKRRIRNDKVREFILNH